MNAFTQFNTNEINNFFRDVRFIGHEEKAIGSIKINGQNIKYQSKLLNIDDIANLFEINPEILKKWVKANAKQYNTMFYKEEYEKRAESESQYKEEYNKSKETLPKDEHRKKSIELKKKYHLVEKVNSVVDSHTQPSFMDPRLIIPSISSLNADFNNWITYIVIGGMCFTNKEINIFGFVEQFLANKSKYMSKIQKEFEENKHKFNEELKNKPSKKQTNKCIDKSIVVTIPNCKTKLPNVIVKSSDKVELKSKSNEFVDVIKIGAYDKILDYFQEYLKEKCKFDDDDFNKNGGMRLGLSNKFTGKLYKENKDKIVDYIKSKATQIVVQEVKEEKTPKQSVAKTGAAQKSKSKKQEEKLQQIVESKSKKQEEKPKPKIGKIQQQESEDDEDTISDFSDNSIDESESED